MPASRREKFAVDQKIGGISKISINPRGHPGGAGADTGQSEDAEDLGAALQSGARGYLIKNIDADYLVRAIRRAAAGEAVVAEAMTRKLIARLQNGGQRIEAPSELDKLTPHEKEILACLARGESNKSIARTLDVAESTVKIHVQNILKKLNLSSRVQAAVFAVGHGVGGRRWRSCLEGGGLRVYWRRHLAVPTQRFNQSVAFTG